MDCHEAKERLTEGRGGAALRRHLVACGDCSAFSLELEDGGRAVAEAMLAPTPSPGFEERVARRLGEEEISVPTRSVGPWRLALGGLLAAGLLVVGTFLLTSRPDEAPVGVPEVREEVPSPLAAVTEPRLENRLQLWASRVESHGPTELVLRFASESRTVLLDGDLEGALLRAWAHGARRADLTVAHRVPTREVITLIEALEKIGFSYELDRSRPTGEY